MKKLVIVGIIALGLIGIAFNTMFGWETFSFLRMERLGTTGLYWYKIDFWNYIENVKNSFSQVSTLYITTPPREWILTGEWGSLSNNLLVMLDWFLFAINIFLYQFRIGGYLIINFLSLLGVNTIIPNAAGGLSWLVTLARFLRDLQIPYL